MEVLKIHAKFPERHHLGLSEQIDMEEASVVHHPHF